LSGPLAVILIGLLKSDEIGLQPSPLNPIDPYTPAIVLMIPDGLIILITEHVFLNDTYTFPEPSTATPVGYASDAIVAGPPSPDAAVVQPPDTPVPAIVVIIPKGFIFLTTWLPYSAIKIFPIASIKMSSGKLIKALIAGPPSPEYPETPGVPAITVNIPAASTFAI
jgi:hypothetical protein